MQCAMWLPRLWQWLSAPSLTDWLNVAIVFALLVVTRRYAESTDRIVKANEELLQATKGILAETARQAKAASDCSILAIEQWREAEVARLVPIHVSISECDYACERFERHLRPVLNDGIDSEEINTLWQSPSSIPDAVERARHISPELHSALNALQRNLRAIDQSLETFSSSGSRDLDVLKDAALAVANARKAIEQSRALATTWVDALRTPTMRMSG